MSRPTLERYLAQLLEKTGATDTTALLALALRQGLLDSYGPAGPVR